MRLSQAVEDYATCAWREVGHSRNTYLNYRLRLRQFHQWVVGQGMDDPQIHEIDYPLLRRYYLTSLLDQGIKPNTIRGHIHALRFLFDYMMSQGVMDQNPMMERDHKGKVKIPLPQVNDAERLLVSDDDIQKILEAAARQANDFKAIRDTAVLSILVFTGIRRAELLSLQVDDINLEKEALLVRSGKGRKAREVPLCREVHQALSDWMAYRRRAGIINPRLFTVDRSRNLGEGGLAHLVKEVAAIAGLKGEDRIKPHSLRHAAATRFLNAGATLKDCQVLLGHTNLKTTSLYLHADEQSIKPLASLLSMQKPQQAPTPTSAERAPDRSAFFQSRRRSVR
jgi:site-specific recombinase XerD